MNIKKKCVPLFGAEKKNTICMTMSLNAKVSPSTWHTVEPHTCIFVKLSILFESITFRKSKVQTWREPQVSDHRSLLDSYLWALITNWLQDVITAQQIVFDREFFFFLTLRGQDTKQCPLNSGHIFHKQMQGTLAARLRLLQQFSNRIKTVSGFVQNLQVILCFPLVYIFKVKHLKNFL